MNVLVNALSVTNQSGRHVLMGHLHQLADWIDEEHQFVVLHHAVNEDILNTRSQFRWIRCPEATSRWSKRAWWEYKNLNRVAEENDCELIFSPAGVSVPGIKLPQAVLCQNPWCLVPGLHHTVADKIKAVIQRRAYRKTMRQADVMIFNSNYMHRAYRDVAGQDASESMIVYQGIAEATWSAALKLGKSLREDNHIVSVSAMAPHKGADDLVKVLALVRRRGVDAKLTLAGGWPDASYREKVEALISQHRLGDHVELTGWISDEDLYELYSRAHVFCLLSRCESFGIPAVEAQSFGTPAIGTTACAIPEIGGDGGLYSEVGDLEGAADNLTRSLTDASLWGELSKKAFSNANRFRWETCSKPLLRLFDA
ncbi:MAG: glycosyltransferase family 4 protein [Planctomycetota bacterium]